MHYQLGNALHKVIRRAFDMAVAILGLLFTSVILVLIALAIRGETKGPIFFSQTRLGLRGRPFCMYKFRKFRHETNSSGLMITLRGDQRMTLVGRVLERTKLYELPQLWNVLIGDMAIVGPRPECMAFADCFVGPFREVLDHKPGLFGPSQAMFRNEGALFPEGRDPSEFYRTVLFPARAQIDLSYFPNRTLRADIGWIARCVLAVLGLKATGDLPDGIGETCSMLGSEPTSVHLP